MGLFNGIKQNMKPCKKAASRPVLPSPSSSAHRIPSLPTPEPPQDTSVTTAVHVLSTERAALAHLESLYQTDPVAQENLSRAVDRIVRSIQNGGKVVFSGVGKSGKIAQKLEASMNSLGVYSAFLHPTEALHGDLGLVRPNDTLLMISFSGRTSELLSLLPHLPSTVPVIAITNHINPSTCPLLAFHPPDLAILLPAPIHESEELSFGVAAPTSSTTVALSLGDALAIAAARKIHTTPGRGPAEVFRSFHPGGAIGAPVLQAGPGPGASSTPVSMCMSTSSGSDDGQPLSSTSSEQQDNDNSIPKQRLTNSSLSPIPIPHIPSLPSPESNPTFLSILLTAIQHPTAKSWVFLSPNDLIPPSRLRALARGNKVDLRVSEFEDMGVPVSVNRRDWVVVEAGWSAEDVRAVVERCGLGSDGVVLVTDGDENGGLGVLEVGELVCDR